MMLNAAKNIRTDLNVPYKEKEEAKALGAKWDYTKKTWYVIDPPNIKSLSKWLPNTTESLIELCLPIYLIVSDEKCYRCSISAPVYSLAATNVKNNNDKLINHFTILNYIEDLPQTLISLLKPISDSYYKSFSKTTKSKYYNNHCIHCQTMFGDFFMHCEPNGAFFPTSVTAAKKISLIELPLQASQKLVSNYRVEEIEFINKYSDKLNYSTWCIEHSKKILPSITSPSITETQTNVTISQQNHQSYILDYWRCIEFFSPQKIPKLAPSDKSEPTIDISQKTPLFPWEYRHPYQNKKHPPKTIQQHLVYCAVYSNNLLSESLKNAFGKDESTFDERINGDSSILALIISQDGRPLFDSFVLSMSTWSLSQLLTGKITNPNWLDGFEKYAEALSLEFTTYCRLDEEDEFGAKLQKQGYNIGKPLQGSDLFKIIARFVKELALPLDNTIKIRVKSICIHESNAFKTDAQDFFNSFFINDLKKVSTSINSDIPGQALKNYLSSASQNSKRKKIDIRQDLNHVFEQLAPQYFPKGCWPSPGHYPLVLSQQFAINSLFKKLNKKNGIFAVNGPPGTGKTTLLRDLIADVIVKRAECLAKYGDLTKVLIKNKIGWKSDQYARTLSVWPKEFEGFSIVVSSCNNGAVENVTYEIPGKSAIDESWETYTNYFSSISTKLIEKPSWALIAARLGNKANRNTFIQKFWYGIKPENDSDNSSSSERIDSFMQILKEYEKEETNTIDCQKALTSFNDALHHEEQLRKERIKWYNLIKTVNLLEQERVKLQQQKKHLSENFQQMKNQYTEKKQLCLSAQHQVNQMKQKRVEHLQFRPRWIDVIFTFGKAYERWSKENYSIAEAVLTAEQTSTQLEQECTQLSKLITEQQKNISSLDGQLLKTEKALKENTATLEQIKLENPCIPDIKNWEENDTEKELSAPWADEKWIQARSILFLEAINLHKAFIQANAKALRQNFHAMIDILSDGVPDNVPVEGIKAAWLTLFFVIPVISTTFASFDRLFKHLDKEDLGWLLIDEAGQATPQSAIGAIWRSQKVVVVGDPLQLEPIISLPITAQQALRQYFKVGEEWVPKWTSVQMLADKVTPVGTFLPYKDTELWVGSPLRVHRRCDNPMFSIVNKIAYDELMVYGTIKRPQLNLIESGWLNVISHNAQGNFIPEEGEMLRALLDSIIQQGFHTKDIFIISPFKQVISELKKFKSLYPELKIGTIHTTQGKESDIVILVLGGNPQSSGAKKWASERPNLLNVAISRAKRKLYVIGNRTHWKDFNYFDQMAKDLATLNEIQDENIVQAAAHSQTLFCADKITID